MNEATPALGGYTDRDVYGRASETLYGPGSQQQNTQNAKLFLKQCRDAKSGCRLVDVIDYDLYGRGDPRVFGNGAHIMMQKETRGLLKQSQAKNKRALRHLMLPSRAKALVKSAAKKLKVEGPKATNAALCNKIEVTTAGEDLRLSHNATPRLVSSKLSREEAKPQVEEGTFLRGVSSFNSAGDTDRALEEEACKPLHIKQLAPFAAIGGIAAATVAGGLVFQSSDKSESPKTATSSEKIEDTLYSDASEFGANESTTESSDAEVSDSTSASAETVSVESEVDNVSKARCERQSEDDEATYHNQAKSDDTSTPVAVNNRDPDAVAVLHVDNNDSNQISNVASMNVSQEEINRYSTALNSDVGDVGRDLPTLTIVREAGPAKSEGDDVASCMRDQSEAGTKETAGATPAPVAALKATASEGASVPPVTAPLASITATKHEMGMMEVMSPTTPYADADTYDRTFEIQDSVERREDSLQDDGVEISTSGSFEYSGIEDRLLANDAAASTSGKSGSSGMENQLRGDEAASSTSGKSKSSRMEDRLNVVNGADFAPGNPESSTRDDPLHGDDGAGFASEKSTSSGRASVATSASESSENATIRDGGVSDSDALVSSSADDGGESFNGASESKKDCSQGSSEAEVSSSDEMLSDSDEDDPESEDDEFVDVVDNLEDLRELTSSG